MQSPGSPAWKPPLQFDRQIRASETKGENIIVAIVATKRRRFILARFDACDAVPFRSQGLVSASMSSQHFDAIIVGARCAGSSLALSLARLGQRVALIDKDLLPSDVISTHFMFPNTVARLESLGVLDRLQRKHRVTPAAPGYDMFGHRINGTWEAVDGISYGISVRRIALDICIYEAAVDAGAIGLLGRKVTSILGSGTLEAPVRGVVLDNGHELTAPKVFGADGRNSIVARSLGIEKRNEMRADNSMMFAYFKDLPPAPAEMSFVVRKGLGLLRVPCEDDIWLVNIGGDATFTRGSAAERERRYAEAFNSFGDILGDGALDTATRISDLVVAPETMMRGYYRQASGPGWALVGDAGHFKHPSTAQGICDAVEQAVWIAANIDSDSELATYETWRDERSADHYVYSFAFATFPPEQVGQRVFRGLSNDAEASNDFLLSLQRRVSPAAIFTPERMSQWLEIRPL